MIDPCSLPDRYLPMAVDDVRMRCTRCGVRGDVKVAIRSSRGAKPVPNPQRVQSLYGFGLYLGALCSTCRPIRAVRFTLDEIARQLGKSDPLVRDTVGRLVCPHCRTALLTSVGSVRADRAGGGAETSSG